MQENHKCCYACADQDIHDVKHPGDAVIDIVLSFTVSSHCHKDFVYSHASGINSEPKGGAKRG